MCSLRGGVSERGEVRQSCVWGRGKKGVGQELSQKAFSEEAD